MIHEGKYYFIEQPSDIAIFTKSTDADYVAIHEHVAMDRIYSSTVYYYVKSNEIKPIGYNLSNTGVLTLKFNDFYYASSPTNLKLITDLCKWFPFIRSESIDDYGDIRFFYGTNKIHRIGFDQSTQLFCYNFIHSDDEDEYYDNEWTTLEEVKKAYLDDLFFDIPYKIVNDVLIINDKWYCCVGDYFEISEDILRYETESETLPENCKKIYHIIYVSEYVIPIYLNVNSSCKVINCTNYPPNLMFSNNNYYGTVDEFIAKQREKSWNSGWVCILYLHIFYRIRIRIRIFG